MATRPKTLRRWFVEAQNKTVTVLCCEINKSLEVMTGEKDMFGYVKRRYPFDSEHLLSDRQKTIMINRYKKAGYVFNET